MLFLWTFYINNPKKKGLFPQKYYAAQQFLTLIIITKSGSTMMSEEKSYFNISQYNCFVCVCVFLVNIKNVFQKQKNKWFGGEKDILTFCSS